MLQCLAGIHKCMDSEEMSTLVASLSFLVSNRNFFLIWKKSAYLVELSVTDIPEIFKPRNPGGTEHGRQCVPGSFSSAHT